MTALAIRQNSPEWLEARRLTIGSSDIPVIVGESPYKDAHTLAAEKLGLVPVVIDALGTSDATGPLGDVVAVVSEIVTCVRIRTDERGEGAL